VGTTVISYVQREEAASCTLKDVVTLAVSHRVKAMKDIRSLFHYCFTLLTDTNKKLNVACISFIFNFTLLVYKDAAVALIWSD